MNANEKVAIANRYIKAISEGDAETIIAMYADDATMVDPVGTQPRVGIDAIRALYEQAATMDMNLVSTGPACPADGSVAFPFKMSVPAFGLESDVIDVFEFNDEGKISSMKAYWSKP